MTPEATTILVSVLLLIANGFFVLAEYGLVGARRSRLESLAKQGNRSAKLFLQADKELAKHIAGVQVSITIMGISIGAITEPFFTGLIEKPLSFLPESLVRMIAIVAVAYPLVVFGELVPKYWALQQPERAAMVTIGPLRFFNALLAPLVALTRWTGEFFLKRLGIDVSRVEHGVTREELALLVRSSIDEGQFEAEQAKMINRALRLDKLDAADVMIHRLDIKWLPAGLNREELGEALKAFPHSRIPVCQDDIDEVLGIVYLQDIVKHWGDPGFSLASVTRPAEFVPESLTLDRVVQRMREARTQILIVRDEYGGTSGLMTLEDVVEEIFGELEDSLESERPPIERTSRARVTARADVRYDELLDFLGLDEEGGALTTETLAEIVVNSLSRLPKTGDRVEIPVGTLIVENMSRRRITRIALIEPTRPVEEV
ncbi:MAG: HlyC/CorC family transporter [Fimbriimonadaceae bacterium]|nr:HlyC/CorC family transporter [Fimbriimonadaceae bacterium]QYK56607.1 MAG: HlyC/CorC family transporter [Fimbriimonadaceae bacterium]